MQEYLIAEEYTLPSLGKVYSTKVNPNVKLRSMTTAEEMKRLAHSELPYKMLCEIIDDCLIEKPGIATYDLCVGDYQYLLYKLRIVTYGKDYEISSLCPVCNKRTTATIDLDSLSVMKYSEDLEKYLNITLPKTGKKIKLRLQTPRMTDEIKSKTTALIEKSPEFKGEPAILFLLASIIDTIDGEALDGVKKEAFIKSLPMLDTNYIIKSLQKVAIGIDTTIKSKCKHCKAEFSQDLPISGEFFGPSID